MAGTAAGALGVVAGAAFTGAGRSASTRIQYIVRSVSFCARSAADAAADGAIVACADAASLATAKASSNAPLSADLGPFMTTLFV